MSRRHFEQNCQHCRHHARRRDSWGNESGGEECRRYPPVIVQQLQLALRPGDRVPDTPPTAFPEVKWDGWCGEWAPILPDTADETAEQLARDYLQNRDRTAALALADRLKELDGSPS